MSGATRSIRAAVRTLQQVEDQSAESNLRSAGTRSDSRAVPNGHLKPHHSTSMNSCSPDLTEFTLDSELTTVMEDSVSRHSALHQVS